MAFFSDIFNSFTGQQSAPQSTIIDTNQMLQGGLGTLQGLAPQLNAISGQLGAGMTANQLANESTIFGPSANQLQQGAYANILDQLNMGENLSPELTNDITRKLYESGAASGFGASSAGRGNVILQTGLEGERRGQQRRNEALRAVGMLPSSSSEYNPDPFGVLQQAEAIGSDIRNVQAARDNYENTVQQIKDENFTSLLNTGGRLIGTAAGAYFGGPAGASIGGNLGGSLFKGGGVAGYGQKPNSNAMTGALGALGGSMSGPNSPWNSQGFDWSGIFRPDSVKAIPL